MKTLSMGMSGDYQIAIREGSTSIRVGTQFLGHALNVRFKKLVTQNTIKDFGT